MYCNDDICTTTNNDNNNNNNAAFRENEKKNLGYPVDSLEAMNLRIIPFRTTTSIMVC